MTDAERTMLLDLLAREGQEEVFEEEIPPRGETSEDTRLECRIAELEAAQRRVRYEAAAMRRDIQALRRALETEQSSRADDKRGYGRRARVYGCLAGVGISMGLLPILTGAASLGWRLFRWLAGILGGSPELLMGGIALSLMGAMVLRMAKPLGNFWLSLDDEDWDDEDWDEEV